MEIDSKFLEDRAMSLATVLLTRHPDVQLLIEPSPLRHAGYDLIAKIAPKGVFTGRMFAVEVKARRAVSAIGARTKNTETLKLSQPLRKALQKQAEALDELTFPTLFIIFAMDTDDGYFGWLREPETVKGRLTTPQIGTAELWSKQTHIEVVDRVNKWFTRRATP